MNIFPEELFRLKVNVVRSRRKTSVLRIVGDQLQVRVPIKVKDEKIAEILKTKETWIRNKVFQIESRPKVKEREFISGETFSLFGKNITLKVIEDIRYGINLNGDYLYINIKASEIGELRKSRIKSYIENWYLEEAYKNFHDKVMNYAKIINVYPSSIKVRNYKTRWGSCDKHGRLTFNLHLIKAPHTIVDYVVIHELCHMIHPNHSSLFWNEVEKFDPAFKDHRRWLKDNGIALIR